jgi:hypothetical protein
MTPREGCDDCRRWIREEAEGLPEESRHMVLRVLEDKHDRRCCMRLMELRDDGEIPAFWNATLDKFQEFAG